MTTNTTLALLIAVALTACVTDESAPDCGPPPSAPGWTVSFDGDLATMSAADYRAIVDWRHDVVVWAECMEGK